MIKQLSCCLIFLLALVFFERVNAATQILVVPNCLLIKQFNYDELASTKKLRLIRTEELTKLQSLVQQKSRRCRGFMNVTTLWQAQKKAYTKNPEAFLQKFIPKEGLSDLTHSNKIHHQEKVNQLIAQIDAKKLQKQLEKLGTFKDRNARTQSGVEVATWIKQVLTEMIKEAKNEEATIEVVATPGVKQSSIILKIGQHLNAPAILMGARMDTLASGKHDHYKGAFDEASGAATLLETARLLLLSHYPFTQPIYLVWYAAEEEGKLGSQSVVRQLNQNKIMVDAVLQLDMTGYVGKREEGFGLTDDLTDAGLTAFVADLINVYIKKPVGAVRCGFACSDHVAWYQNGNRVAYPFETMNDEGNPFVHTRKDTLDKLSMDHMADFVKLALAFSVELGEPA